ncbi:glycosyltransferase family A protein [Henriciella sp.]|uniref:glycosyltransferase n=1 Tax=Henriciella sp. TaxID=1968823 RepID=UPI002632279C|nr:glycosyltransferase family A protein [Henriciella sp.]
MDRTKVSVVFRALNEGKWFDQALEACRNQDVDDDVSIELVLVDSGSTDRTIEIAKRHDCKIYHIAKSEFTFGRSLNMGCDGASGDILVFISAHCIPVDQTWLSRLISPLREGKCDYVYGRQVGHAKATRFSEAQVFNHYYGSEDQLEQGGFFCNNANSAILRSAWEKHRFDEAVTGLEDMVLAKAIVNDGGKVGYVADAGVVHIHEESLRQTYKRYYREALVMRDIMPEIHFNLFDLTTCLVSGITHDLLEAAREKRFTREFSGIFGYRFMQYWGTYRGHNEHRQLSRAQKESYYYPRVKLKKDNPGAKLVDPSAKSELEAGTGR